MACKGRVVEDGGLADEFMLTGVMERGLVEALFATMGRMVWTFRFGVRQSSGSFSLVVGLMAEREVGRGPLG